MNYNLDIKKARINAGLTQQQFSDLFEIPLSNIKSWDSGRREPPKWVKKLIIEKLQNIQKENLKNP